MSRQLREADVLSVNGKTSSLSSKSLKSMTRSATKRTRARTTLTLRGNATPLVDDSDEENDGCVIQEDEQTTDADEDDVIAPSVSSPHKRGHQTGLSISLSNTTIAHNTRKRSWSNCTKEEDDNDFKRPKKLPKTESGNLEDEDSDTGYEGVDLISDSDDDDTERDEEAMIIQSEEYNDDPLRPASSSSSDSWGGFPDNGIAQESDFFTEHFERSNSVERSPIKPTRRVRFVDEVDEMESSCTNTTDLEDNFFPDLFLQQDRLDPRFRAIIEKESDSEGSYWDFGFGDHYIHDPSQEAEGRDNNDGESSGYESDDGETTDEEILPPPTIRPQSSQNLDAKSPSRTPQKPIRRSYTTPGSSARHQGPSLASWIVDPAKPYAIVDKTGSNMIFYPAQRPQSRPQTANASMSSSTAASPTRPSTSGDRLSDRRDVINQDILLRSPANLMMSGFAGNGANIERLFGSHVVGPPEAFFPWRSIDSKGQVSYDDNDDDDDDEDYEDDGDYDDDLEENLDINDFIDFGEASESNEEGSGGDGGGFVDTPVVGRVTPINAAAFRRNQLRVQTMNRQPRAFKADTVVKVGRLDSANQPISPLRKQKPRKTNLHGVAAAVAATGRRIGGKK